MIGPVDSLIMKDLRRTYTEKKIRFGDTVVLLLTFSK